MPPQAKKKLFLTLQLEGDQLNTRIIMRRTINTPELKTTNGFIPEFGLNAIVRNTNHKIPPTNEIIPATTGFVRLKLSAIFKLTGM